VWAGIDVRAWDIDRYHSCVCLLRLIYRSNSRSSYGNFERRWRLCLALGVALLVSMSLLTRIIWLISLCVLLDRADLFGTLWTISSTIGFVWALEDLLLIFFVKWCRWHGRYKWCRWHSPYKIFILLLVKIWWRHLRRRHWWRYITQLEGLGRILSSIIQPCGEWVELLMHGRELFLKGRHLCLQGVVLRCWRQCGFLMFRRNICDKLLELIMQCVFSHVLCRMICVSPHGILPVRLYVTIIGHMRTLQRSGL